MRPPSRLAVRLAKRLKDEQGIILALEPENYRINRDQTAAAINRWGGEDYWTWSLAASNVYGTRLPLMATVDEKEVEVEIGSYIPASVLLRIKEWAIDRERLQFTILASTKGIWPR